MNEAETRAEHIDPALKAAGWGVVDGSRIRREYPITLGRIEGHGKRGKALTADYVLEYRNTKLAVVEAKAWDEPLTEGVGQAKNYAAKLALRFGYSTNGRGIYGIDMETGLEGAVPLYPSPDELWGRTYAEENAWRDRFGAVPFEDRGGYSLKEGINDGFLTPFKVKQIQTTLDEYVYTPDDRLLAGEVEHAKLYEEKDFNRKLVIDERERKRIDLFMAQIKATERTLVFCATQEHALAVRDYINQIKTIADPNYCVRVTADDGDIQCHHSSSSNSSSARCRSSFRMKPSCAGFGVRRTRARSFYRD